MPETEYMPVAHDHEVFFRKALGRKGFAEAYEGLEMSTSWCANCWPPG